MHIMTASGNPLSTRLRHRLLQQNLEKSYEFIS